MHVGYASAVTPAEQNLPDEEPRQRFARIVRQAREERDWTQEELAVAADVSRPTVQRYENGRTATPEAEAARRIFRALGLDARLIPVVLGYVTAEEMGLPPEPPRVFSPTAEEAIAILENPAVPAAQKAEWLRYLRYVTQDADSRPGRLTVPSQKADARKAG